MDKIRHFRGKTRYENRRWFSEFLRSFDASGIFGWLGAASDDVGTKPFQSPPQPTRHGNGIRKRRGKIPQYR